MAAGDTITLGNVGDTVNTFYPDNGVGSFGDTITLGKGAGDTVNANNSSHNTITLGKGAGDTVKRHRQQPRYDHPRQRRR